EAKGQNIVDLTPAEQTIEQSNEIMKELSEGNSWSGEFLVKRKDGSIFPAYVTDAPIIDSDGKLTGIIGISNDVTDRKNAEESLRESHQIIEGIINSIPVRVFWKDRNLTYLGCNNLFAQDAGFINPNEIVGKDDFQMGWRDQAELYRDDDRNIIENGRSKLLIEEPQTTPEGKTITLLTSKIPLINSANETIGVLGIYIDISERKQAEEEIKKSHEELIKTNAEKDKFFSIIAHDLKTPFNGFLNLTELMADTTEKFSLEEFAEYSNMLNKAARNLYLLLENLLEWAQIQKGTLSFTPGNSDLSKMVSQSIDTIYQRALQKRIEIINKINDPQNVYADEKSISTVLRNLLSNAVKFTRMDGKVIVESKLLDDETIEVAVADNGVGISADNVNKLFKMEEKIGSIGTDGELSTGLGLLLCKEFIEMHGGKIWVESTENKGSTFYFTLRGKKLYETN
ncbi:MAG: PAS domain-containing sensor histidine kinase, partial [Ignavibacteriaceae bacterium]